LVSLPFSVIGSSAKEINDGEIDEDDEETVSFTLKVSTDIEPGDYNIPYIIKYVNADDEDKDYEQTGSFSIRIGAKTNLDFVVETKDNAIVGQKGSVSLEIINQGLGNIKSVSIQIFPQGFELLSKDKIFIGTIDSEDTDLASFDVIYKTTDPVLKAKINYKDFDNEEQIQTINLPFKVYTKEQALELGIIKKNNAGIYVGIFLFLIIIWIIYKRIKKRRKKRKV